MTLAFGIKLMFVRRFSIVYLLHKRMPLFSIYIQLNLSNADTFGTLLS